MSILKSANVHTSAHGYKKSKTPRDPIFSRYTIVGEKHKHSRVRCKKDNRRSREPRKKMWRPRRTNVGRPNFEKILNESIVDPINPTTELKVNRKTFEVPKDPSKRKLLTFNFTTQKHFLKSRRPRHSQRGAQKSFKRLTTTQESNWIMKIDTNSKSKVNKKLKESPVKTMRGKKFMEISLPKA